MTQGLELYEMKVRRLGDNKAEETSLCLPRETLLGGLLASFCKEARGADDSFSSSEIVLRCSLSHTPFLTVVTRTQGDRLEEIQETLLCLQAQSDQGFELVIVGHNLDSQQIEGVKGVISLQPSSLKSKISFLVVRGGGRSRPLNAAFEVSGGEYIAFLDDDDLVFDNWVESFRCTAAKRRGTIVHSFALAQRWARVDGRNGEIALSASDSPSPAYCNRFDFVREFGVNACPIMSLAFPRYVFEDLDFRFREELSTNEDWDFLMRAAMVCGVSETEEVTSIYRVWDNAGNSLTAHNVEEWFANETKVIENLKESPLLLPPSVVDLLVKSSGIEKDGGRLVEADDISGYFERCNGDVDLICDHPEKALYSTRHGENHVDIFVGSVSDDVKAIRINLCEEGVVTFYNFEITTVAKNGSTERLSIYELISNGIVLDETTLVFLHSAPHISIRTYLLPSSLERIKLKFGFSRKVSEDVLCGTRLVVRARAGLKRYSAKARRFLSFCKRAQD